MRRLIDPDLGVPLFAVRTGRRFAATATPFGGATTSGGILTLVSNTGDVGATNDASGASFTDTGVTTFASITTLSDRVRRHRRRLQGGLAALPGTCPDTGGREERLRVPRAGAVLHGLRAERVDRRRAT